MPLIQAGLQHQGFALIDVLSPCVTFNDHEGSTKSYAYTREHYEPAVHADFVPLEREITADYGEGETLPVVMHDGSRIVLRKLDAAYDPTNRTTAAAQIQERMKEGEYLTGLLYVEPSQSEFHELNATPDAAEQPALRDAVARLQGAGEGPGALPLRVYRRASRARSAPPAAPASGRPAAAVRRDRRGCRSYSITCSHSSVMRQWRVGVEHVGRGPGMAALRAVAVGARRV